MSARPQQRILELARSGTVVRTHEMRRQGIESKYLRQLQRLGWVTKRARGMYSLAEREVTPQLLVAKRLPDAVLCLHSALAFHGLVAAPPSMTWIARGAKSRKPKCGPNLPISMVYSSDRLFDVGVEEHIVDGVQVRVYSAAKTVSDFFRFRHVVGFQAARDALITVLDAGISREEILSYARICRVRKYVE